MLRLLADKDYKRACRVIHNRLGESDEVVVVVDRGKAWEDVKVWLIATDTALYVSSVAKPHDTRRFPYTEIDFVAAGPRGDRLALITGKTYWQRKLGGEPHQFLGVTRSRGRLAAYVRHQAESHKRPTDNPPLGPPAGDRVPRRPYPGGPRTAVVLSQPLDD
jgi:hypothetical protein